MIAAVIVLGVVVLAALAFAAWREHEHRAQLSEALDRIQAPEAVQIAAVERAVAHRQQPVTPPHDVYDELVAPSQDVALESLMEAP